MDNDLLYAWSAGIIDGEGHVNLQKTHNQRSPVVQVGNTDKRILYKLEDCFGGRIHLSNKKIGNKRECWKWCLSGSKVIECLDKVIPFLVSKKEKAKIVLAYVYTVGKKPIDAIYRDSLISQLKGQAVTEP